MYENHFFRRKCMFLRSEKFGDIFFSKGKKFNTQWINLKTLLAIQIGIPQLQKKFQEDWYGRYFEICCTNLGNLEKKHRRKNQKIMKYVHRNLKILKHFLLVCVSFTFHGRQYEK